MAITETRPDAPTETHVNPWDTGEEYPSFAATLGTGDHKTIGRFYIGFALLFGLGAWVLQGLSALQAGGVDVLPGDTVDQVFTLGRVALVLLFAVPLFVGLATYLVPLQVGASTVAFPRAAAAAFWSWLLGSVVVLVAYATNGGVAGGRARSVDLFYLGLGLVIVALLLATVCVLTTAIAMRTPGMSLDRVPMFTWASFVAGGVWLLTMPVLLANLLLIYLDHHLGRPTDFGVAAVQWPQIDWFFGQPQVFAFAIPVLGVVGDVVATTAGVRQRQRGLMLAAIGAFGILSFGAFAQQAFNEDVWEQVLFVAVGVAILLPTLLLLAGWATTMRSGTVRITTGSLGALLAALLMVLATAGSAVYVIKPLDLHETASFQVGLLALLMGVVATAGVAALHHWAPKITGGLASDGLGKLLALVAAGGAVLAGLPLMVLGFATRFDVLADAADALNLLAAAGAGVVVVALLLTGFSLLASSRAAAAGDDPWGGQTLEWATSSPPPTGNFGTLAPVTSAEPLLDAEEDES